MCYCASVFNFSDWIPWDLDMKSWINDTLYCITVTMSKVRLMTYNGTSIVIIFLSLNLYCYVLDLSKHVVIIVALCSRGTVSWVCLFVYVCCLAVGIWLQHLSTIVWQTNRIKRCKTLCLFPICCSTQQLYFNIIYLTLHHIICHTLFPLKCPPFLIVIH